MATAHVLIADISGSTRLYDTMEDHDALARISAILARMREIIEDGGGICVKSQGDDTLSYFPSADQAFAAARAMIENDWDDGLNVHAGACCGEVLSQDADIYGDTVNMAARLAALAKPREVLLDDTLFAALDPRQRALCVSMGGLELRGKAAPVGVHSFAISDMDTQTVLFGKTDADADARILEVELTCDDAQWTLGDAETLTVGRATDCDAVLSHPWVSRRHGSFELRAARLEYTDHSSSGSTVITGDGQSFTLQRRSMLLTGSGVVLVGTQDPDQSTSVVRYTTLGLTAPVN